MNRDILNKIKGGLIVSCQALEDEPMHSSFIMSRMAYAAREGGASGIRANTVADIMEIRKTVDIPIIGIVKRDYEDSGVFITPTMDEVDALAECGVDIIAADATHRGRPNGKSLDGFFLEARNKYPDQLFMADCSSYEEGIHAACLGFDLIGTTLNGYTPYTRDSELPNLDLIKRLAEDCRKPVIAEGGIWTPKQLKAALAAGALAAVVGTAITRPRDITRYFIRNSGCRERK
ncbi:N-acetylmannosamine-6-phosphate 2-epimerase [Lachnospiraceae bacterium 54-53]